MKFFTNRKLLTLTLLICFSMLFSVCASAYEYIVETDIHGDPTIQESEIVPFSAADVARYYPSGSYHSVNRKACTCHSHKYPSESCNCGRYYAYNNGYNNAQGSSVSFQCAAFAKFCFHEHNGFDVIYKPDDETNGRYKILNTSNLYDVLNSISFSSYIRGTTATGTVHSVFVVGFTSSTVTIWHSNYTGPCQVENKTLTYSEFLARMSKIDFYYTAEGTYVDL